MTMVRSNDVLIVSYPGTIAKDKVDEIKAGLKRYFPTNEVLFLTDGLKLDVLQRDDDVMPDYPGYKIIAESAPPSSAMR